MGTTAATLQSVFSTLLRVFVYIYLRIIPVRPGRVIIPATFASYFVTWILDFASRPPEPPVAVVVEEDEKVEVKPAQNGDDSKVDVAVTDTIAIAAVPLQERILPSTILFSLPTTRTPAKLLSLLINLALVGMVADFLVRPTLDTHADLTFTRVGAVYHDAAKIVVRYPEAEEGVRIVWKQLGDSVLAGPTEDFESGWTDGPLVTLGEEQDWVGVTKLSSLWPNTRYQYRLAAANATLLPYPSSPIAFKTFPDPRIPGTKLKFIASSCIAPNYPYTPFQATTRIRGFELLAKYLESTSASSAPAEVVLSTPAINPTEEAEAEVALAEDDAVMPREANLPAAPTTLEAPGIASVVNPVEALLSGTSSSASAPAPAATPTSTPGSEVDFMILLGDFIYADLPTTPAQSLEAFRTKYRATYASEAHRAVYERLPTVNIYDDHEIENDFNGYSNDSIPLWQNASSAWSTYQGSANYDVGYAVDENGRTPNYYDFMYGDVAFFVLDTRRYRSVLGLNTTEGDVPTILGEKQLTDLRKWAVKVNNTAAFKFIISSVPLTGMWGPPNGQIDTWMGAPAERRTFIELFEYVPNVVVISGDRHEFAAVEHLGANSIHEFSISPLSQFYVPYIRTLWPSNAPTHTISRLLNTTDEEGNPDIREVEEEVAEEHLLKYIPHGNYKWGTFEVDTTNADAPTVKLDLLVDGAKAWEYTIVGKPVHWTGSTSLNPAAIAESVTEGVKNVISKLGRIFG